MASTPPPVPTRSAMTNSDGTVSRPWLNWFTTLGQLFGFNQTVQAAGVAMPQEPALNFLAPFTVTDNPGSSSTDIGVNIPKLPFTVQFGLSDPSPQGGDLASIAVVFPTPFATVPVVVTSPDNYPRGGVEPFECYPTNITVDGFTANFACSVPTGGGGATITNIVHANWIAIGT